MRDLLSNPAVRRALVALALAILAALGLDAGDALNLGVL